MPGSYQVLVASRFTPHSPTLFLVTGSRLRRVVPDFRGWTPERRRPPGLRSASRRQRAWRRQPGGATTTVCGSGAADANASARVRLASACQRRPEPQQGYELHPDQIPQPGSDPLRDNVTRPRLQGAMAAALTARQASALRGPKRLQRGPRKCQEGPSKYQEGPRRPASRRRSGGDGQLVLTPQRTKHLLFVV